MFSTGLKRFKDTDVNTFTSDIGIKLRRSFLNKNWRRLLKLCTSRKIIVEQYPELDKDEAYVFAVNHSFDEDAISALATIDRNVYMLQGTTDQMEHNPVFLAMWLNGMIYVDRMKKESRQSAVEKMKRILAAGSSVVLFPEGGYNNTENQLIQPLFSSPYVLSKEMGVKVVPMITFYDCEDGKIYVRAGEPMDLSGYEKYEALNILRDEMSTLVYQIMELHVPGIKRESMSRDARKDFLETRKRVYECQKWHSDVWDEEVTYYPGHGVTTPKQAREFVDDVNINHNNAYVFADMLVRREEDMRYDLKKYLREHMKYAD